MRKAMAFSGMAALCLICSSDSQACGDKFLVVGRGVKYSRVGGAPHAASILIYGNPASKGGAAVSDAKFAESLKKAGHKVLSVSDPAALNSALKSAKYDLVLADVADSPSLEKQVGSEPTKPQVVPILYEPTTSQLSAAQKDYGCALKAPSKDYLSTIDDIMARRLDASKTAKGK